MFVHLKLISHIYPCLSGASHSGITSVIHVRVFVESFVEPFAYAATFANIFFHTNRERLLRNQLDWVGPRLVLVVKRRSIETMGYRMSATAHIQVSTTVTHKD